MNRHDRGRPAGWARPWGGHIAATRYDGACSADSDGDLIDDPIDNCPSVLNDQTDGDADGLGNECDPGPSNGPACPWSP